MNEQIFLCNNVEVRKLHLTTVVVVYFHLNFLFLCVCVFFKFIPSTDIKKHSCGLPHMHFTQYRMVTYIRTCKDIQQYINTSKDILRYTRTFMFGLLNFMQKLFKVEN